MWLRLWPEREAEQDAELQKAVTLRITGMCWLHLPCKEGDRGDWSHTPTAYDALNDSHPNLYAPRALAEVIEAAKKTYPATVAHCDHWIIHYENRIAYKHTMLDKQGGLKAEGFDIQPSDHVLVDGEWLVVMRVNREGGQINSVTMNARYVHMCGIEEIRDYRAPAEEDAVKVKKAAKLPPLVNLPDKDFIEMTAKEYKRKPTDYRGTYTAQATARHGVYRYRTAFLANSGCRIMQIYITDAKHVDEPAPEVTEPMKFEYEPMAPAPVTARQAPASTESTDSRAAMAEDFQAVYDQLRAGVQVVNIPQLFPIPTDLAARMIKLASTEPGACVLGLSAGTDRILEQLPGGCEMVTMRISATLGGRLDIDHHAVMTDDSLQCTPETLWGPLDHILMNPPSASVDDIKYIHHALCFLKPGGKLVAICTNGPRQDDQLRPLVEQHGGGWESLPPDTFAGFGTVVSTALLALTA